MDRTFILIASILILFFNRTDRFDLNSSIWPVPEVGALKGFSDSFGALNNYWETSLEKVTSRIVKGSEV